MPTEDYLEEITEYSEAVQVTVRNYDGSLRVFNLDHSKVVLRYVTKTDKFAYHPSNIQNTGGFRPDIGHYLELAIVTNNLITLESD